MFAECRTTGRDTNCFVTLSTSALRNMKSNFVNRNWVRFFFIGFVNGIQCIMCYSMQGTFESLCHCEFFVCCNGFVSSGQLVCRRHAGPAPPSRRAIHDSCTQLLPLIEMYCKWVLQEDCSDLHSLMLRFESEAELQTHEPGRSLLMMLRDDDGPLQDLPHQTAADTPANLFDVMRNRLAAADLAIRELNPQVHILSHA